jgi:hypothetical protein
MKEIIAYKCNLQCTYQKFLTENSIKPRNFKQVDNLQYHYHNLKHELDHIVRLQIKRKDIIHHLTIALQKLIIFFIVRAIS